MGLFFHLRLPPERDCEAPPCQIRPSRSGVVDWHSNPSISAGRWGLGRRDDAGHHVLWAGALGLLGVLVSFGHFVRLGIGLDLRQIQVPLVIRVQGMSL